MKICNYFGDDSGCTHYRQFIPMNALHHTIADAKVKIIKKGDPVKDMVEMIKCDILHLPRLGGEDGLELIEASKAYGSRVLIDYDDNIFKTSPLSIHYKDFGTENVQYVHDDGSVTDIWKDGKNIDLKKNKKGLDQVKRCIEKADAITTTTEILADVYRQYNPNVFVLPNCVDLSYWNKLKLVRENPEEIRLYWSGGASHYEDVYVLKEVLPYITNKYPYCKVVIMGSYFGGVFEGCRDGSVEVHGWVKTDAYPFKSAILDADISLIPLQDTEFNRCKSNIKWVEQSALLVPSVTSLVSPYKEWYNGTNGAFIKDNDPQGWIQAIEFLINNPEERTKMAKAARQTVEENFNIDNECIRWYNAYQEILNGKLS